MKNFLLSIFAVMLAVFSVQAEEVTLNASDVVGKGKSGGGGGFEYTVSPISFNFSSAYGNSSTELRFYKSSTLEISGATITKVQFTAASSKYGGTVTANSGSITVNGLTQTWEGSTTSLIITATGSQIRTASIVVTYTTSGEGGGDTPEPVDVAEPTFTPADGETFEENLDVTIAAEEGLAVYYSTDNKVSYTKGNSLNITETTTVYAYAEDAEGNQSDVVSATYTKIVPIDPNAITETIVASETGISSGVAVESLKFGNVTATFDKGSNSNATKYYSSGTAFRAYGGNTITFTGDAGVTINSVVFTFGTGDGSNEITVDCGTYSNGTWVGASNNVVFTIGGSSGNRRLAKITVTYSIEEGVVVIATPSIAGEETFVGSTTVEITNNAEEGTTLYYSTNGVDYVAYNGALNITETTTVYAYAQDAQDNKSSVASATFTKLELLSIAEAKAAYDAAGANVDVAMDLTGAVVTVNNGSYMFIETDKAGINFFSSGAKYAVGTKFTSGYVLGISAAYNKLHQITSAQFCDVVTETVDVIPTPVTVEELNADFDAYEGRFVVIENVAFTDFEAKKATINQGADEIQLYNQFALSVPATVTDCDIEGIVGCYKATYQIFPTSFSNTVEVTGVGYATLFLGYPVAIPAGVEAYAVTEVNNGFVTMTQVTGILPANTGVILKNAGEYTFTYSTETATTIATNLLLGTATDTNIDVEAYVLGKVDGVVGLYKAQMTDGVWLNNANKAYLPASVASGAASYSFRFGEGTTGINEVKGENGNVKAIFDLTGRRVENISEPGIYIVGGKKVLVK